MPQVDCPGCGAVLPLTDAQLGRRIECGACGRVLVAETDADPRPSRRRPRPRDDDRDDFDDDGYRDPDDDLPPARPTSSAGSMAITGLVLGIVGVTLSVVGSVLCCPYLGAVFGVLGIIFGVLGRRSEHRGMAVAGIATGAAAVLIATVVSLFFVAMFVGR